MSFGVRPSTSSGTAPQRNIFLKLKRSLSPPWLRGKNVVLQRYTIVRSELTKYFLPRGRTEEGDKQEAVLDGLKPYPKYTLLLNLFQQLVVVF